EAREREDAYQVMKERVMEALKKTFRPEFLNRLDGIMVFRNLTRDEIKEIVDLELGQVRALLSEHDMTLEITDEVRGFIADKGYNPEFGARPLRRIIQSEVEDPLSEGLLAGRFKEGDAVLAYLEEDREGQQKIQFRVIESESREEAPDAEGDTMPALETMFS
ncbi:MAG TPA: ATP-dependent Clp protease ATP-binding subunit, partial [Anaerolineae bacterium]|nr:ATP-dependent Clp protease ATP-binding subunit [Anaerolineae bacterium]